MLGSEYNEYNSELAKLLSLVNLENPHAPRQWQKGEQSLLHGVFHSSGGREIGFAGTLPHTSLSKRAESQG